MIIAMTMGFEPETYGHIVTGVIMEDDQMEYFGIPWKILAGWW